MSIGNEHSFKKFVTSVTKVLTVWRRVAHHDRVDTMM